MRETFSVPEISCGHCKSAIEGALRPVAGIHTAEVDVDERTVTVERDPGIADRSAVVEAIEGAGYEVAS